LTVAVESFSGHDGTPRLQSPAVEAQDARDRCATEKIMEGGLWREGALVKAAEAAGRQAKAIAQDGVLGTVRDRVRLWAVEAGLRNEVKASECLGGVWGLVRDSVPRLALEAWGMTTFGIGAPGCDGAPVKASETPF
jgi:hypothetical protein